jgi:NAD-dependent SIR2 family protein deacetylase
MEIITLPQVQEFLRSERNRTRYWARSYVGWKRFAFAQPGPTHKAIAQLESRGFVENIITQNVDRFTSLIRFSINRMFVIYVA